jgi:hypothetical protein
MANVVAVRAGATGVDLAAIEEPAARAAVAALVVQAARAVRADLGDQDRAASSATTVQVATATAARPAGKHLVPVPGGCCLARRTVDASMPKTRTRLATSVARQRIAVRREIAAHRGIHASTTVAHGRPGARREIVLHAARARKMRRAVRARVRREARAGEIGRPSDLVRQMAAQGQDRARRATADADSVHGGPMAAMVDPTLVLAEGVTTAIGSDVVVAAGTSQPCRKSRTSPPPPLRQLWRQRCQR